jgi:hypothetical protein
MDEGDRYEIDHSCNGSVIGCEGLFKEDAKRIVACVNFLTGIPTDDLNLMLSCDSCHTSVLKAIRETISDAKEEHGTPI